MSAEHRFSRLDLLVGKDGLARLGTASITVFGVGGVGSFAVEALTRGGVGRLTLVDFDDICLTNVNRQLHALEGTIGRTEVQVMAERCRAINPAVQVEALKSFYSAENSAELLDRGYDFVLDCIDHITAKLHLIESCLQRGLPVISSMGAANKVDPNGSPASTPSMTPGGSGGSGSITATVSSTVAGPTSTESGAPTQPPSTQPPPTQPPPTEPPPTDPPPPTNPPPTDPPPASNTPHPGNTPKPTKTPRPNQGRGQGVETPTP